ncbi:hypothetical protein B566_EDAN005225 [Ephemera danica]|nr:hypothetical protein B566_EDAN005225 [Ephemera danica]
MMMCVAGGAGSGMKGGCGPCPTSLLPLLLIVAAALLGARGAGGGSRHHQGDPSAIGHPRRGPRSEPKDIDARVRSLLEKVPLIDGHNDLPWNIRSYLRNHLRGFRFTEDLRQFKPWSHSVWSHTDLYRLQQGMVGAQFWSAYAPCSSQYLDSVQLTLEQIDVIRRLVARYPQHMEFVTSADGIMEAHRSRRLASLIGVEGGHAISTSLAVLRVLYRLGARYLTLTHTCSTPWADCSTVDAPGQIPDHNGLTDFGKTVVLEMNRLGMMVDLSHASVRTMLDVLETTRAPVIFSHSAAHALCNSSRNVPDHVLRLVAQNGGIVMVAFYNYFVSCNDTASIRDVLAHINHIRDVAGADHGLEDVSGYPRLFGELLASPRWNELDVQKLAGLNLLRVMRQVEKVRDEMRAAGVTPSEESIPAEYLYGKNYCRFSETL